MKHGNELSEMDVAKTGLKDFNATARKYNIDYSVRKDASTDPPRWMVMFKAKDQEVMNAAFREYIGKVQTRERAAGKKAEKVELKEVNEIAQTIANKHQVNYEVKGDKSSGELEWSAMFMSNDGTKNKEAEQEFMSEMKNRKISKDSNKDMGVLKKEGKAEEKGKKLSIAEKLKKAKETVAAKTKESGQEKKLNRGGKEL
jgi:hypothetical protein